MKEFKVKYHNNTMIALEPLTDGIKHGRSLYFRQCGVLDSIRIHDKGILIGEVKIFYTGTSKPKPKHCLVTVIEYSEKGAILGVAKYSRDGENYSFG